MLFYVGLFLKGLAMGAANVIPGVSGGTIAFITGIYERLINAIKAFDIKALKLLLSFKIKELLEHIDFTFLVVLFAGVGVSILSLAKLLELAFCHHETLTLSFFFGLILASVHLVAKDVSKWNFVTVLMFAIGTAIAVGIGFFNPAQANDNVFYMFICGIVAISSMILPGISGSYVLLIMGNYILVMNAVSTLKFNILVPLAVGCAVGLFAFSHLIAFIFKKFRDGTISLLAGFVFGSLVIIWPWKHTFYKTNELGQYINKKQEVITEVCKDGIVLKYQRYLPDFNGDLIWPVLLIVLGIAVILLTEKLGAAKKQS